jgi:hypothetical protein
MRGRSKTPGARSTKPRYLTALAAWGYNPSDIEQATIDTHAAEQAARTTAKDEPTEPEDDDEDTVTDGASEADEYYNGDEYEGEVRVDLGPVRFGGVLSPGDWFPPAGVKPGWIWFRPLGANGPVLQEVRTPSAGRNFGK